MLYQFSFNRYNRARVELLPKTKKQHQNKLSHRKNQAFGLSFFAFSHWLAILVNKQSHKCL